MNAHNNKDDGKIFKHGFTLSQFATLALVSNWAQHQAKFCTRSTHSFNLFTKKFNSPISKSGMTIDDDFEWPEHLSDMRDFFSHYHAEAPEQLSDTAKQFYASLIPKLLDELNNR